MALRKTHVVLSEFVVMAGVSYAAPQIPVALVSGIAVWIGSQLPDADLANTRANHWFGPLGPLLARIKHRTWTHSLLGVVLMLLLALFIPVPGFLDAPTHALNYGRLFLLMLCAGYLLHLVEDAFSDHGIPWLYPFGRQEASRPHWHYRTGGRFETVVRSLAWVGLWALWAWLFKVAYLAP